MKPKFSRYKILQKIRDSSNWTCASTFSVFALCVLASIKPAFSSDETTENDKEKSSGININYGANVEYESLNGVYQNGKSSPGASDDGNGELYFDTNNSPHTYNSHNSNQKLGNIEDVISFPNINIGENGIYYSAKNNYQDNIHKIEQNAYSDYEVYKNYFLRPQDPIPKSKVKFKLSSRIIQTRYGKLQGIILSMDEYRYFKPLEVFLGVPYATPPVGSNRFSPTRTPSPWDGIRVSNRPGPACPQKLPDLSDENAALETMPKGRLEYLKRLLPFLKNQSEDCLYMNIFAPYQVDEVKRSLPVVVYVHGESFEWNSGNSYDGSVLAGYADVIVVTLNFRLGLFGFLNANPTPSVRARVANYGLMDQIAALHWVQQNVALFGGDASNITLIGHGTGAACINFLMISPTVMPGLFHRAILLSGSALSSWAIVEDPVYYSLKLAKHVNCTIPEDLARDHETIVDCLREIAIEDLLSADITPPNFLTAFGPSVDGVVIKTDFAKEFLTNFIPNDMHSFAPLNDFNPNLNAHIKRSDSAINRRALQNKYDLMFGVVTSEALSKFSAHDIQNGFESERRDRILRTYVRNAYSYHLSEIFYTVVNEYTDWERSVQHPINMRDSTIDALSDAQYIAPLVQSGDLLSGKPRDNSNRDEEPASTTSKTFFYVFDYQTKDGDYPQRMGSVHGEELPYLFGAPLVDGFGHFPRNYTKSEVALAESFMLYISNFARSGNPNEHFRQESILAASKERNKFRIITWDEYDAVHQKYLEIGMKPKMKNHFRAHQLSVWLRLIPELHRTGMEDVVAKHNMFRNHNDQDLYEGIVRPDPLTKITSHDSASDVFKRYQTGTNNNTLLIDVSLTTIETIVTTCINVVPNNKDQGQTQANITSETIANLEAAGYAAYSTALSVTIAIGCSLLILNVLIFAGVYYQRDKIKTRSKKSHSNQFGPKKFDTISTKQSNYQMEAIQNPTVILDVETQNKLSRKNNKVQNDSNIVNLNFKGPITQEDLSLHLGNRVSMNPLQLNSDDHNMTLPHRAFNRNDVNNSSFKSGPNLTNYHQMSRYATLPKNISQPQSFNNFNNDIMDKHCLPPNGSAVMIDNRSNDSPKSNLTSSHPQRGVDPVKPTHHSINMPQAAIDEMRV